MGALKNSRQEAFCLEYACKGRSGAKAAIAAGYSQRSARQIASELQKRADVRARIEELKAELKDEAIADAREVLEALTRILRREEPEQQTMVVSNRVPMMDENGKTTYTTSKETVIVDVKPSIAAMSKAAELLGRHLALFAEKVTLDAAAAVTIINDIPRTAEGGDTGEASDSR